MDYSKLLKLSEDLTEQLEHKTLVNIELEKNLQSVKADFAQLKNDVAVLVQDKVLMEQRLQRSLTVVKKLTAVRLLEGSNSHIRISILCVCISGER